MDISTNCCEGIWLNRFVKSLKLLFFLPLFTTLVSVNTINAQTASCDNEFTLTPTRTYNVTDDETIFKFQITRTGADFALSHWGFTFDPCVGTIEDFLENYTAETSTDGVNWTNATTAYGEDGSTNGDCTNGNVFKFDVAMADGETTRYFRLIVPGDVNIEIDFAYVKYGDLCCLFSIDFGSCCPPLTVNDPADQTLCAGATTTAITFTGEAGTVFEWTNNNTSIGLAASGTGNIAAFVALNAGTTVQVATITVTPTKDNCSGTSQTFTITVNPNPTVDAGDYGPACSDDADIALGGTPAGGVWTGTGVSGNQADGYTFDPSVGTQTLTYTYTNQYNCAVSDQTTITVTTRPTVDAGNYGPVCSNAPDINLAGSPAGGVWTGTGVSGNQTDGYKFDPSVGTQTLTYTIPGDCGGSDQTTITVYPNPTVDAGNYGPVCKDAPKITLSGSPAGGVWTGTGVTYYNGVYKFNPAYGTQTLKYTYTNANNCSGKDYVTIVVNDKPSVDAGNYGPLCDDGPKITLGGTPAGGVWSGAGVSYYNGVYKFNPAYGTQTIRYTYTDRNGCTGYDWVCIRVIHCFEGCTPGYWKNHYEAWCNGTPGTFFFTKFSGITNRRGLSSSLTLTQALSFSGGGYYALARHAVAALQNACHNAVDYPYTTTQIVTAVKNIFNSGSTSLGGRWYSSAEALKNELDRVNNLGCPLNNSNAVPTYRTNSVLDESTANTAMITKLSVEAFPNPYTDVVRFVIQSPVAGEANLQISNMLGQKIATVYKGRLNAQSSQIIEFRIPTPVPQAVIYTLTIGEERVIGKLMKANKP